MVHVYRRIPTAELRLLVFDLDGTLIDSRRDLVEAVNAMLAGLGLPRQADEHIASYIGDGAGMLVERALRAAGADLALAPVALDAFLACYRAHKLDHTRPYAGVSEALEALRRTTSLPMAVLTNKPVVPSREICDGLGLGGFFFKIYGGNSFATKKPNPEGLRALMAEAGAQPGQTLLVGDSHVDAQTARAAGAWMLGCRFGLSPGTLGEMERAGMVDASVDAAGEWLAALGFAPEAIILQPSAAC